MSTNNEVYVWDALVRFFHWSLVGLFVISYLTGDEESWLHVWSGYAIVGLLVIRVLWGLVGSKHARFSDFIYGPSEVLEYTKGLLTGKAKRYLGHNPLGGLMVLALLGSLVMTTFTGMLVYGVEEGKGPLAGVVAENSQVQMPSLISTAQADDDDEYGYKGDGKGEGENEFLEETHEFFANFTVLLVLVHLFGVIFESVFHKESLVRAMLSGKKQSDA